MNTAFPILIIAIGIAVLALGKRLAVLGAAVGALLGVGLLRILPGSQETWLALGLPILLAVVGFFGAAVAKGSDAALNAIMVFSAAKRTNGIPT